MSDQIKSNLYPCLHCSETGTCTSGLDGTACGYCQEAFRIRTGLWRRRKNLHGLVCGVCGGLGLAESQTEKINKRMRSLSALLLMGSLLAVILFSVIYESPYFSQILAFAGPLLGGIVAYYFTSQVE